MLLYKLNGYIGKKRKGMNLFVLIYIFNKTSLATWQTTLRLIVNVK